MTERTTRRRCGRGCVVAGLVLSIFAFAGESSALYTLGGIDVETQYTGAGTASSEAGILTFDDALDGYNSTQDGIVTTYSIGLDALLNKSVAFEALLGPTRPNGLAFDPAVDNLKQARFIGTGGYEFRIYDGSTTLLALDLVYLDVTNGTWAVTPDPDGSITLGDPTLSATSSLLHVSGGSLNQLVGGIGSEARLQIQLVTLSVPILAKADLKGYLNDNFTSGVGSPPVSTATWELAINPIPEPGTASLLGFALLGLVGIARRGARFHR